MRPTTPHSARAFTLIEVMIALGIFFMAVFTILGVISSGLRNARGFQRKTTDDAAVATAISEVSTNEMLVEGVDSPSDFSQMFPGYTLTTDTREVESNKLFKVDILIQHNEKGPPVAATSVLIWAPKSKPGTMDGGLGGPS